MSKRSKKLSSDVPPAGPASAGNASASAEGIENAARNQKLLDLAVCAVLILASLFIYAQVSGFEFVDFDDPQYVGDPHVLAGWTAAGIKWAFTSSVVSNWTPLTLLSLMLDVQLFGLQSGASHSLNVLFHVLAAIVLFFALRRKTGERGLSAFVAFVFAVHPLHVESVAWVTERKDVLSVLFAFLALYAYVLYAERPSALRYASVAALFCLGLMSKPMLVTFPFVLLLFDAWPLRRDLSLKLMWEKLPLLALSAAASLANLRIHRSSGDILAKALATRIENAFISYVVYIKQTVWPARLAFYYPYPVSIAAWEAVAAGVFVLGVSVVVLQVWRSRPYLAVGWFWYLGTLVPVIGLVQAGAVARADRFMYMPMVGLLIVLAWGAKDLADKWPGAKVPLVALAVICCLGFTISARATTEYWHDSETLSRRAMEVTENNAVAENTLGTYLVNTQRTVDAIPHFENAVHDDKDFDLAHFNLGAALSRMPDRANDAIAEYEAALRLNPQNPEAHNNLAVLLNNRGDHAKAIAEFEAAIRLDSSYASAYYNLASCLLTQGEYAAAIPHFQNAIRLSPNLTQARLGLAEALGKTPGRASDAIQQFEALLKENPDDGQAHAKLGELLADLGRESEAIPHLEAALRAYPDPSVAKLLDHIRAAKK